MLNIEFAILDFIQKYMTSPIMDKVMVFITTLGNSGGLWIILSIILICSKRYRMTGIMMGVGLILSLVVGNIILKPAFARLRPFQVKEGVELLINAPRDFSFPSGHTLASAISAAILLFREKKLGLPALIVAILIAFSRLYLYVHFPTDVLGGAVFGVILGFISIKITENIITRNKGHIN